MDVILKAIIVSGLPESLKRLIIERIVPVAHQVPQTECQNLLRVCWDTALNGEGEVIPTAVHRVFCAWAPQNLEALAEFLTPSLLFSPLRDDPPRNVVRFLELLACGLVLLRGRDGFPLLRKGVQDGCLCLLRKCRDLPVAVAVCALLTELPECLPAEEFVGSLCSSHVRILATTSSPELLVRLLVNDAIVVADFLQNLWRRHEIALTKTLKAIHSQLCDEEEVCSPILAAIIERLPEDMAGTVTCSMIGETSSDRKLTLGVSRMVDWLSWPGAARVDVWLIAVFRNLARSNKHLVLRTVFFEKIEAVFRWAFLVPTQRASLNVLGYMLLCYRNSFRLFRTVAPGIPALVCSMKKMAGSEERDRLLRLLSDMLYAVMYLFPGYPDSYEPILEVLQGTTLPLPEELECLIADHGWAEAADLQRGKGKVMPDIDCPVSLPRSETGMTGLINLGNTCYINSILQALYMTDRLRYEILQTKAAPPETLLRKLQEVFAYLSLTQRPAYLPASFVQASRPPWFEAGEQQDCSEFLRYLLDRVHECQKSFTSPNDGPKCENTSSARNEHKGSLVKNIFGGVMRIAYKCLGCEKVSAHEDGFLDLHLAFPEEVSRQDEGETQPPLTRSRAKESQELVTKCNGKPVIISLNCLIRSYFQTEVLEGNNKYHCNNCQSLQDGERTVTIVQPPEHLILTLLRFSYDATSGARGKILCNVQCPEAILLPADFDGEKFIGYALYAAVVHSGTSPESGHYYTYGRSSESIIGIHSADDASKQKVNGHWYLFNDSRVSFSSYDSLSILSQRFPRDTAYVLFYKRVSSEDSVYFSNGRLSSCDVSWELAEAISMDNAKFIQEQEAEMEKRKKSNLQIQSFDHDRDSEGPGPPMGGCGGSFDGLDQSFNRFVC